MKLLGRLLFVLLIPLFLTTAVFANEPLKKTVVLNRAEIVNHDYFAAGDVVTVSGTINGDAYVAGGTVLVDGIVNGDLLAAGGTITVRGPVKGNVRAVGGMITIASRIGQNVTVGAGTFSLAGDGIVGGSIVAGGANIELSGPVGRGAVLGAGNLVIANRIGGDVLAGTSKLTLTETSSVAGALNYWSDIDATIAKPTAVLGRVTRHAMPEKKQPVPVTPTQMKLAAGAIVGFIGFALIIALLVKFILGLILFHLFPVYTDKTIDRMNKTPWRALGIGIVTLLVIPAICLILTITLIGIPLAAILGIATWVYYCIAYLYASLFVGKQVLSWLKLHPKRAWQFLVGLVILGVLVIIPVLGLLVRLMITLVAMGALITQKFITYSELRKHNTV